MSCIMTDRWNKWDSVHSPGPEIASESRRPITRVFSASFKIPSFYFSNCCVFLQTHQDHQYFIIWNSNWKVSPLGNCPIAFLCWPLLWPIRSTVCAQQRKCVCYYLFGNCILYLHRYLCLCKQIRCMLQQFPLWASKVWYLSNYIYVGVCVYVFIFVRVFIYTDANECILNFPGHALNGKGLVTETEKASVHWSAARKEERRSRPYQLPINRMSTAG